MFSDETPRLLLIPARDCQLRKNETLVILTTVVRDERSLHMDSTAGAFAETDLRDEDTLLDFDTAVLTSGAVSTGAREGARDVAGDSYGNDELTLHFQPSSPSAGS